jgi:hypothetical protein
MGLWLARSHPAKMAMAPKTTIGSRGSMCARSAMYGAIIGPIRAWPKDYIRHGHKCVEAKLFLMHYWIVLSKDNRANVPWTT